MDLTTGKPVKEKGNPSKKMALCPNCHNTLRRSTLVYTGKLSFEEYGKYLAELANWDVNKRVKWEKIFRALNNVDSSQKALLWVAYRKSKASINPDYAARKEAEDYEKEMCVQNGLDWKIFRNKTDEEKQEMMRLSQTVIPKSDSLGIRSE